MLRYSPAMDSRPPLTNWKHWALGIMGPLCRLEIISETYLLIFHNIANHLF